MVHTLVLVTALAAHAPAAAGSPYLDVVARYQPGAERDAIVALAALRLRDVDRVFEALDRACRADGAKSCQPRDLEGASPDVRDRVIARWRLAYPRVLALHAEALVAAGSTRDAAGVSFHIGVLVRLAARCEEIARRPDAAAAVARLAVTAPRVLLWVLQYLRDEAGLDRAIGLVARDTSDDVELWLARGALAELRTRPDAIAAAERDVSVAMERRASVASMESRGGAREQAPTDVKLDGEIELRLQAAVRVYRQAVDAHPDSAEGHLRLGRLLAQLDRLDEADRHLGLAMTLQPDPRQAYLASLFLADLRERQARPEEALAAYAGALQAWPGAQAPVVALARLRAIAGPWTRRGRRWPVCTPSATCASDPIPGSATSAARAGACPAR